MSKKELKKLFRKNWNNVVIGLIAGMTVAILLPTKETLINSSWLYKFLIGVIIGLFALIFVALYSIISYIINKNTK